MLVIEHNMEVGADHLIDLGPEGGEAGGKSWRGTPEDVSQCAQSYTGQFCAVTCRAMPLRRIVWCGRIWPQHRGRRTTMPLPSVVRVNTPEKYRYRFPRPVCSRHGVERFW